MRVIKHRDGERSLRMTQSQFDDLVAGIEFAWLHWLNVAQRSTLTGRTTASMDGRIRDDYREMYEELNDLLHGRS